MTDQINARKILFLGETYRADAITWMDGLRKFGNFDIVTWELRTPSVGFVQRMLRMFEYAGALLKIRKLAHEHRPDMVIAERTTSYGFLAALSGVRPVAIAQQGITDLWPETSPLMPLKRLIQNYAFRKATLIHAWGKVIAASMQKERVDMTKVLVLPKGVRLDAFRYCEHAHSEKINAVVTRSLSPEYRHEVILKAFGILRQQGIDFTLTIVGDGIMKKPLEMLADKLGISQNVIFPGRIPNTKLPEILQRSNFYISMPVTEGVSSSLFEAMASGCYPIVSDIPGNRVWIRHRENGELVAVDHENDLAQAILWAWQQPQHREQSSLANRKFVEAHASFDTNMKIIADRYHQMITESQKTTHVRH